MFQSCFESGIIPKPIPKSSKNDPKLPLSCRDISLISCVYKLYSTLLNCRLVDHFKRSCLLVGEQNVFFFFSKARASIAHIYVVTSSLTTRIKENLDLFILLITRRRLCGLIRNFFSIGCLSLLLTGRFTMPLSLLRLMSAQLDGFTNNLVQQGDVSNTVLNLY